MKRRLFLILFLAILFSDLSAQNNYWQQQVNYKIDVTLNAKDNSLDGFVKMEYTNNSPDKLDFIWIHLWPNAYKNDKTAFSDQMLENGRTGFYFSENDSRGYINRLDFKVNGLSARFEDHPQHIDIGKLILPVNLDPGKTIQISTPFHVKLPLNFSRGGHVGQSYQITQWYPKPAVYDRKGWHEMPYLDQGEFYSEFGTYEVQITVPASYIVAATGVLQDQDEMQKLLSVASTAKSRDVAPAAIKKPLPSKSPVAKTTKIPGAKSPVNSVAEPTKTLHYKQDRVHDFAWFADRTFEVDHGVTTLNNRKIDLWSFYRPQASKLWKNSIKYLEQSIQSRSKFLGDYPYAVATVVEAPIGFSGGMEYPTITSISPLGSERDVETTIEHEVGHNWNYGILASNERMNPWMDEGINSYYDDRYEELYPEATTKKNKGLLNFSGFEFVYRHLVQTKKDQPIETPSGDFSETNYGVIAYYKTSKWMKLLEKELGREMFDSAMHNFYSQYSFKHPYPEDLKQSLEQTSGKNLENYFQLLSKKGPLPGEFNKRPLKVKPLISLRETDKYNMVFVAPAVGINFYDKLMLGVALHNYTIPSNKFQFFIAPMYATGSKEFAGIGRAGYSWYPSKTFSRVEISASAAKFNMDDFVDSTGKRNYMGFEKFVPSIRFEFKPKSARSSVSTFLQWKTFFINEENLRFDRDTIRQIDIISYPKISRFVNQLKLGVTNSRVLYPYRAELQVEQGKDFARAAFEGNYYFNFKNGGGLNMRLFGGKFFYTSDKTFIKQYETDRYHLNMTGPKGYEDYTYSNYFIGRNEFEKISSQQIMIRDGGFKVRTDLLAAKVGRSDDWLGSLNFTTDIPKGINPLSVLPIKIPVKLFVDIGTYAEAWKKESSTGRFLYDAGLQVSAFHNLLNIYIPVLYSKVYSDYFKSTITEKRFLKNISFSIDIQRFNLKNILGQFGI